MASLFDAKIKVQQIRDGYSAGFGKKQGQSFSLVEEVSMEDEPTQDKDDIAFFNQGRHGASRGDETMCMTDKERSNARILPGWHEFADHIYVLGRDVKRRKHMKEMLSKELGVPAEKLTYYSGFDCKSWPPSDEFKAQFNRLFSPTTMGRALGSDYPTDCKDSFLGTNSTRRPGCAELCCSLGHFGIAKAMLAAGYGSVLVLEDDACATENLGRGEEIVRALSKIKDLNTWNFVKLGDCFRVSSGAHADWFQGRHRRGTLQSTLVPATYLKHSYCTHAFAMSKSGAELLLEEAFPIEMAADDLLLWLMKRDAGRGYV
jgi:hypothetical protein